ncbi:MAG TPA: glucosyltransferase domain-containing protein [Lachnospiraceae bacterium]
MIYKEKIVNSMKDYWKESKLSWWITVFFLLLTYGIRLTSVSLSHDTEAIISVPDSLYESWYSMGRFSLVFMKKILGVYNFNPVVASFLMFFVVLASSLVWMYLFSALWKKEETKDFRWVFPTVFFTSVIMAEQFGFLLQVYEVSIGILLLGLTLLYLYWIMINKKRFLWYIPAFLLTMVILSIYQALIFLYPVAVAVTLLIYCEGKKQTNEELGNIAVWSMLIKFVLIFVLAFLCNQFLSKWIMNYMHIKPTEYLLGQINWGKASIKENVNRIFEHIKEVYTGKGIFYSKIYGLLSLFFFLTVVYKGVKKQKGRFTYFLIAIFCLMGPFVLTILMAGEPAARAQFCLPFLTGFYFWYLMMHWREKSKTIFIGLYCLGIFVSFKQSFMSTRLYYTNYVQYQEDVRLAVKISDRIDQLDLGELPKEPVVFVGRRLPQANVSAIPSDDLELIGKSFWELSFGTSHGTWVMNHFLDAVGYSYVYPTKEEVEKAEIIAKQMPLWPNTGSVVARDGIIVVRLSE